ncbi:TRAP transporter substrate-binding protein [Celerinatantimonas sp. MCCC 1A17872]|uniref:TRAP transporter substrate-binding protein n=1 Tax=Celerinatantimonas sp. MCCC 1A17872 TaxID=3177514 RepID=UPI0038C23F19
MTTQKLMFKLLTATALIGLSTSSYAITLKLSHNQNRTHPVHKAMLYMAKEAAKYSDGDLKIRVYPNAQLGTQRESLELVQNGALAMAKSNAAELESFDKEYKAFSMPYLFKNREQFYKVLQSEIGQQILQSSKAQGFIGLTYYDAGSRSFYAKKPINSPADLKGMKIRVQPSPTAVRMIQLLGGNPTPLAFGELYTALQQGVVDAAENNVTALTISRHGEVAKYYSMDQHAMIPDVLVISTKVWNKLPPKDQKALKKAADESMLKMKDLWAKEAQKAIDKAKSSMGVKFIKVDKAPFKQAVQPMYQELKQNDPQLYKLVDQIEQSQQ